MIKKIYYDGNIGIYGCFVKVYNDNYYINKLIELSNINIKQLNILDNNYDISKIEELFYTKVDIKNIKKNTPFGWSKILNKWLYFTEENNNNATHYSINNLL